MGPDLNAVAIVVKIHHPHFHGSPFDYSALAIGAFASWVLSLGPGEPLLIAAGVLAAKHKLDLSEVLLVAFTAATVGGILGWILGLKAGRRVLTARGPLHHLRLRALERGEEVFGRWPVFAILLTPSWVAGVHGVRTSVYLLWNLIGAAAWALSIGLGAYLVGPSVVDLVDDAGWLIAVGVLVLVGAGVGLEVARRRRRTRAR